MRASNSSAILAKPGSNYWDEHPDSDVFKDFYLFLKVSLLSLNNNNIVDTGGISLMVIHKMVRKEQERLPYP